MDREALLDAYVRRKKWEFRTQAIAMVNMFNQAMGGASSKNGTYNAGYREIDPDAMLQRIGPN